VLLRQACEALLAQGEQGRTIANPACIKNTKIEQMTMKATSTEFCRE